MACKLLTTFRCSWLLGFHDDHFDGTRLFPESRTSSQTILDKTLGPSPTICPKSVSSASDISSDSILTLHLIDLDSPFFFPRMRKHCKQIYRNVRVHFYTDMFVSLTQSQFNPMRPEIVLFGAGIS